MADATDKVVYWHRDLPPLSAEPGEEHSLEATSKRVPGTISHGDELWHECYADLLVNAEERLKQEVRRFGCDYAHVVDEWVDSRRDDAAGEVWLRGRFKYLLYRRARASG